MAQIIHVAREAGRFSLRHGTPMKALLVDYPFSVEPVPDLRSGLEHYCRDSRVLAERFALEDWRKATRPTWFGRFLR